MKKLFLNKKMIKDITLKFMPFFCLGRIVGDLKDYHKIKFINLIFTTIGFELFLIVTLFIVYFVRNFYIDKKYNEEGR